MKQNYNKSLCLLRQFKDIVDKNNYKLEFWENIINQLYACGEKFKSKNEIEKEIGFIAYEIYNFYKDYNGMRHYLLVLINNKVSSLKILNLLDSDFPVEELNDEIVQFIEDKLTEK